MMNEHPYFHWDLLRQPLQTPQFGMAPSFFDVNSILELRKEKSRDAARSRRGKENYEFYELAKLLPLPAAITSQLDKASIIRLTISYLKLKNFSSQGDPQWTPCDNNPNGGSIGTGCKNRKALQGHRRMDMLDPFESQHGTHILQSLDGFAFILANDGRFLYISETVSIYLGLSQVEMAGSSIFDYIHQDDHGELTENLGLCSVPASGAANTPPSSGSDEAASPGQRSQTPSERGYSMVHQWDKSMQKSFCIRMKSTLTKRGAHVKTSGYRVLHILGTLRPQSIFGIGNHSGGATQSSNTTGDAGDSNTADTTIPLGLVGMAFALPPPTVSELRLELDTFILRLSPGFTVTHCDPPLSDLVDLTPDDVNDRILYDLCHVADLKLLQQAHSDIITKGQALTDYWRLMNRHGGYTWIQTFATTLFNNKSPDDQTILAINYVISGVRNQGCCEDLWQVTGDVTSSMSSTYRCPVRDQILKGLQKKEATKEEGLGSGSRIRSGEKQVHNMKLKDKETSEKDKTITTPNKESKRQKQTVPAAFGPYNKTDDELSKDNCVGNLLDNKNSRRKMDNPRKRKKSEDEPESLLVHPKTSNTSDSDLSLKSVTHRSSIDVNPTPQGTTISSVSFPSMTNTLYCTDTTALASSPEDLSVKKSPSTRRVIDGLHQHLTPKATDTNNEKPTNQNDRNTPASTSQPSQIINSSVNELEAAMNRHLQTQALDCKTTQERVSAYDDNKKDYAVSTSGSKLFSMPPLIAHGGQWVPSSPRTPPATAGDILPTSDLLKCLYTTRESVIRTNARSQNQNKQTSSYLNGETPSSLLTPPDTESTSEISAQKQSSQIISTKRRDVDSNQNNTTLQYFNSNLNLHQNVKGSNQFSERDSLYKETNSIKDQFQFHHYKDPLSYIDHFASGYKDHMTSPYKDFPQFKDIVPAFTIPNLVNSSGRFQHNYPSLTHHFPLSMTTSTPNHNLMSLDSCDITPPASNTPDVSATNKSSQKLSQHHNQHASLHNQHLQHHQNLHSQTDTNTPAIHSIAPHPTHQTFNVNSSTTYSSDSVNDNTYNNLITNSKLTPNETSHSQNLPNIPIPTSAPSPNRAGSSNSYTQYRHPFTQEYNTSTFYPSQDLTKAGAYYGMPPTPAQSMYTDLNNAATSHYDVCHKPSIAWY